MATRKRKLPSYKDFKIRRSIKHPIKKPIPSVLGLLFGTWKHMWKYKKLFFSVILITLVLNIVLVKGFASGINMPEIKQQLQQVGLTPGIALNTTILGLVVAGANSNLSEVASVYQSILTIISCLAFIWLFRQTYDAKKKVSIKVKDPFYEGMAPVIPFILQLMLMSLQLLPMVIGLGLFGIVQANGLAVTALEISIWVIFLILMIIWGFYLVSGSFLSLIIVTLPDMTPIKAYKMSKKVIEFRRLIVLRKLLFFLILFLIIIGGVMLLFIMVIPNLAEWVWLGLSSLILPVVIGSGYRLYRSLL